MKYSLLPRLIIGQLVFLIVLFIPDALAHDPVFGLGPHVLFKNGVEIATEALTSDQGNSHSSDDGCPILDDIQSG